ncbi:MAG: NADH:flavin oxidoreductase/NADH oxidase [Dehalococcoidia bacterium]
MPSLFDPVQFRSITLRNRIGVSPMCQYSATSDGSATNWHLVHLGSRAVGGAGLIMTEMTSVESKGRLSHKDLGIYDDIHIEPLKQIVDFVHAQGASIGMQLGHSGRKAWTSSKGADSLERLVAPSAINFDQGWKTPDPLTENEISGIVENYTQAAIRADKAGFDGLEIHAAHGYLVHQFLSPLSNVRNDSFGGKFENRIRFLTTIVSEIRRVLPKEKFLAVRISCTDWIDGGWDLDESIKLARQLSTLGVDFIDCSSGGLSPQQNIPVGPGYQVPFSEAIKKQANIDTAAVGMITTSTFADQIIKDNKADIVFLGRESLRNPQFALTASNDLDHLIDYWPDQYRLARP